MNVKRMPRILRSLLLALPLATVACGSADAPRTQAAGVPAQSQAQPERPGAPRRIVFLGDSLTAGLGLPREQSMPSLIQERLDGRGLSATRWSTRASPATRRRAASAGWTGRSTGDVEVLVIELGANDGLRGLPVAQMKRNLDEIITRAKARDITVILTGMEAPPNYGPLYTAEFRQVFRDLADEHDVVFVPFYLDGVAGIPALNNSDGIHPNAEGARIIAGTIWRALEPVLDKDR